MSLVYHLLSGPGTLAEHMEALPGVRRSESTSAERRTVLLWALFAELWQAGLRPLAQKGDIRRRFGGVADCYEKIKGESQRPMGLSYRRSH